MYGSLAGARNVKYITTIEIPNILVHNGPVECGMVVSTTSINS